MSHADFSREHSWHWIVRFQKKKNIYIFFFSLSSERSRGYQRKRRQRFAGGRGSERGAAGDSWGYSGVGRGFAATPPLSFRPRYFPALFLIYEPSGDSSFRSLINEGPDWIRDCNSGKFSGREITPLPRPPRVYEQRDPGVGRPALAFKCDDKEILITQRPPSPLMRYAYFSVSGVVEE